MAHTFAHKFEAKFRLGLLSLEQVPINIRKKWDRHNFDVGFDRIQRINKRIKTLNHEDHKHN